MVGVENNVGALISALLSASSSNDAMPLLVKYGSPDATLSLQIKGIELSEDRKSILIVIE